MKKVNWIPCKNIDVNLVNSLLENSIKDNQFTNYGPNVKLLENIIKTDFFIEDEKDVIVVCNASHAIQCLAAGIEYENKNKIKWATQSFTFPPSAQGYLNDAKIVDIDLDGGLNLEEIDNTIVHLCNDPMKRNYLILLDGAFFYQYVQENKGKCDNIFFTTTDELISKKPK